MNRWIPAAAMSAFVALSACSDPNEIQNATFSNVVDTVTVYTMTFGSISQPSAYSIFSGAPVRTWEAGVNFEFVYDKDLTGRDVFLPVELLDILPDGAFKPGLKRPENSTAFSQMTKAPLNGYTTSDTIPIAAGDLFYVRTTVSSCSSVGLSVPLYAKVHVIDFDTTAKTVRLEVLADQNCGYRGLKPGIPKS